MLAMVSAVTAEVISGVSAASAASRPSSASDRPSRAPTRSSRTTSTTLALRLSAAAATKTAATSGDDAISYPGHCAGPGRPARSGQRSIPCCGTRGYRAGRYVLLSHLAGSSARAAGWDGRGFRRWPGLAIGMQSRLPSVPRRLGLALAASRSPGAALSGITPSRVASKARCAQFTFGRRGCRRCCTASWWRRINITAVSHASSRRDSRSHEANRVTKRHANRRHMISDHHGRMAGRAAASKPTAWHLTWGFMRSVTLHGSIH